MKADGEVVSITNVESVTVLESLPAASLTLTVSELYVPAARVSNTIVVLPLIAFAGDGEVIVCDTVIAPASSLAIANDGVVSLLGVVTAVCSLMVGAVWSTAIVVPLAVPVVDCETLSVIMAVNATLSPSPSPPLSASNVPAVLLIVLLVTKSPATIV